MKRLLLLALFSTGCLSYRIGTAIKLRNSIDSPGSVYPTKCVYVAPPAPSWCQPCYDALQLLKAAIQNAQSQIGLPGSNRRQSEALAAAKKATESACLGH